MIGMCLKLRTFDRGIEAHFVIASFSGFSTDNLANRWRQTESKFSPPLEPANQGYGSVAGIKKVVVQNLVLQWKRHPDRLEENDHLRTYPSFRECVASEIPSSIHHDQPISAKNFS